MSATADRLERDLATRLVHGRWRLSGFVMAVMVITAVASIATPRAYEASATLAAVSTRQMPSLTGGLAASLLGNAGLGGIQPTPGFLVRLSRTDGVLRAVALRESPSSAWPGRLVDAVAKRPAGNVPDGMIGRTMRQRIFTGFDTQTGLLTLRVVHPDTLVARATVAALTDELSAAFTRTSRAQATQLRLALESRLDSARLRLDAAASALIDFDATNREVASFSRSALERQRLSREVSLAERAHQEAASERESAVARELEATPAVVVVDPPPPTLPPAPRGTVLKALVAGVLATVAGLLWITFGAAAARVARGTVPDGPLALLLRESAVARKLAALADATFRPRT